FEGDQLEWCVRQDAANFANLAVIRRRDEQLWHDFESTCDGGRPDDERESIALAELAAGGDRWSAAREGGGCSVSWLTAQGKTEAPADRRVSPPSGGHLEPPS